MSDKTRIIRPDKNVVEVDAAEEVKSCMYSYGMEVIENRALPDFRDGLKPVQRAILYYMASHNYNSSKNYTPSANVVGGVLGKLHPHGDAAIYGSLINLNNNLLSPVDGHGGWGDLNSEAAAMRYTKTRLSQFGDMFLSDLHVADYIPNYSGDWEEPLVIPSPIPMCLLSGTAGIAVGVATSVPGHNLAELVNAFLAISQGTKDIEEIVGKIIKGPETYYGGVLVSTLAEVTEVYRLGRGKLAWRCKHEIVFDDDDEEWSLIISGIPDGFRLESWMNKMAGYAEAGNIISVQNESNEDDPVRIVVKFDNIDFFRESIEDTLYCTTNYDFNVIMKGGETELSLQHFNFVQWVENWLDWREEIEIKLVNYTLGQLKKQLFSEETRLWACSCIDDIIALLKKSTSPIEDLMKKFKITEEQANIVAEMKLRSISKLSKDKQEELIKKLKGQIQSEKDKLKNPKRLVENTLTGLLKFSTDRMAEIDYGDKKGKKEQKVLDAGESKPSYWAIQPDKSGHLAFFGSELPARRGKLTKPFISLINASKGCVVVAENGQVEHCSLSNLEEGDAGIGKIAGMFPVGYDQFIVASNNGFCGNYEAEQNKGSWEIKFLKSGDDKIIDVAPIKYGDVLWVHDGERLESFGVFDKETPMIRANKTGWRGLPETKGRKDLKIVVIPKGYTLVLPDKDTHEIEFKNTIEPSPKDVKLFLGSGNWLVYNPNDNERLSLAISGDGGRFIMTGKDIKNTDEDIVRTYWL